MIKDYMEVVIKRDANVLSNQVWGNNTGIVLLAAWISSDGRGPFLVQRI